MNSFFLHLSPSQHHHIISIYFFVVLHRNVACCCVLITEFFRHQKKLTLELILTMPLFLLASRAFILSLASKNINYDSQGNKSIEHKSITDEAFIKIFSLVVLNFQKRTSSNRHTSNMSKKRLHLYSIPT
jgi:hypothetical protein